MRRFISWTPRHFRPMGYSWIAAVWPRPSIAARSMRTRHDPALKWIWTGLKDFLALAEQRNFSRAAEARNVSQPACGRRIRALEDWIGTPLFVRSAQGALLTPAGDPFRAPAPQDAAAQPALAHPPRRQERWPSARPGVARRSPPPTPCPSRSFPAWIRRHTPLRGSLGAINLDLGQHGSAASRSWLSRRGPASLLCHHHPEAPTAARAGRFEQRVHGSRHPATGLRAGCGGDAGRCRASHERPMRLLAYSPASGLGRILAAHRGYER